MASYVQSNVSALLNFARLKNSFACYRALHKMGTMNSVCSRANTALPRPFQDMGTFLYKTRRLFYLASSRSLAHKFYFLRRLQRVPVFGVIATWFFRGKARLLQRTAADYTRMQREVYTICLQHICIHSARYSIFKSMFNCLKPGGRLSIQMGYGVPSPATVPYYADPVQASETNRGCDVAISSPEQVRKDLEKIAFTNFEYWLRPVGPGDVHPQWIFFTATKPSI